MDNLLTRANYFSVNYITNLSLQYLELQHYNSEICGTF